MVINGVSRMKALSAKDISRSYGGQSVLSGFSLEVEEGGFVAVMGPSGCGKSTFLNIAAGLISADSGELFVGGRDVLKMSDSEACVFRRRDVGVVYQEFNLIDSMSVYENIVLPLKLDGAAVDESRLKVLSEMLSIGSILNKKAQALSGGEKQRAAIARALIAEPRVVLADEPTGSLDIANSRRLCEYLSNLKTVGKSAIVLVTHDPMVGAVADRVHFIKDGKIAVSHDTCHDAGEVSRLYLETYK